MNYQQRLENLAQLSQIIQQIDINHPVVNEAYIKNNWFTPQMIMHALKNWALNLQAETLLNWLEPYDIADYRKSKTIGIIMAGNIPLVGLHDLLSVLAVGHKALVKTSSNDEVLINFIVNKLIEINPEWQQYIFIAQNGFRSGFDAAIATGSNNTNRYFEYYFRHVPHLLRKNRNSLAVLTGFETPDDYVKLADDIFLYFGLGCRNVSKILIPHNFNFEPFFEGLQTYNQIIHHHKYANNYTYHKAIFLMNQTHHLDNGFVMLKEDTKMASPLSVVFYEFYQNSEHLNQLINVNRDQIQCIISKQPIKNAIPFGSSQQTKLTDYADGIDTIEFLKTV